jgi:hypothetical protein
MAEDHVSDLKKARDELVRQRRATISALTEGDKHTGHQLNTLIKYQQAIDAIDRLIKEEQRAPKSPLACSPESNTRTDPTLRSAVRSHVGRLPVNRAFRQRCAGAKFALCRASSAGRRGGRCSTGTSGRKSEAPASHRSAGQDRRPSGTAPPHSALSARTVRVDLSKDRTTYGCPPITP